jgi:hypothetical protein
MIFKKRGNLGHLALAAYPKPCSKPFVPLEHRHSISSPRKVKSVQKELRHYGIFKTSMQQKMSLRRTNTIVPKSHKPQHTLSAATAKSPPKSQNPVCNMTNQSLQHLTKLFVASKQIFAANA